MRTALINALRSIAESEVLPRYQHVSHDRKADGSLLTEADLATQRALDVALRTLYPCPVLGEEMTSHEQHRLWQHHDRLWCVDPIDGTSNFVHGIPYFGLSVALMEKGRPILGAVYDPIRREAFSARAGQGAWLNDQPLVCQSNPAIPLHHAMAAIDFKRLPATLATRLVVTPPYASQRNFGACTLEWCHLAANRFSLLLHGGQKLWDYAAGALVLEEAGGCCHSLEGHAFWEGQPWTRSVVAANQPLLHQHWYEWLSQPLSKPSWPR